MKAMALFGKDDIRQVEKDKGNLHGEEVEIRILYCGVCGSDVRMYYTGPTPRYKVPVVLGHEIAGEVVNLGPQASGFEIGDLVTVAPIMPCLRCDPCLNGNTHLCEQGEVVGTTMDGGFAEAMIVPEMMVRAGGLVRVPEGVSPIAAALTEPVSCCFHGLQQVMMPPGARVLIIGDGPIGLTFLQLVRLFGAGFVATSGRRSARRQLAEDLGASEALDAREISIVDHFDEPFDLVIVATSNTNILQEAIELTKSAGDLILFSGYQYGTEIPLNLNEIHYRELHIHGSIDATLADFNKSAHLLPQLEMEKLLSKDFPLDQIDKAFHAARHEDVAKVMIRP
jgi:L-iditol 2-dehydrogenase